MELERQSCPLAQRSLVHFTHRQKQAEPEEQDNLPQDFRPVRPLWGPGDLGNASLDEIPRSRGGEGPFSKAPAPWREGADVLGRKKSVQPLSYCLPETGKGTEWDPGPVSMNQIVQIFVHTSGEQNLSLSQDTNPQEATEQLSARSGARSAQPLRSCADRKRC